jgi:PAS domain S-box-containing protein
MPSHAPPPDSGDSALAVQARAMLDHSAAAVVTIDDDQRFVDANPTALRMLSRSRDELVGQRIEDVSPSEMHDELDIRWDEFLRTGEHRGEWRLLSSDGHPVDVEYAGSANVAPGSHLFIWMVSDDGDRIVPVEHTLDGAYPGRDHHPLTPREREVLTLIARGLTSEQIADQLVVSGETIRTHARNALAALGARTRAHAVAIALQRGLIDG